MKNLLENLNIIMKGKRREVKSRSGGNAEAWREGRRWASHSRPMGDNHLSLDAPCWIFLLPRHSPWAPPSFIYIYKSHNFELFSLWWSGRQLITHACVRFVLLIWMLNNSISKLIYQENILFFFYLKKFPKVMFDDYFHLLISFFGCLHVIIIFEI